MECSKDVNILKVIVRGKKRGKIMIVDPTGKNIQIVFLGSLFNLSSETIDSIY